MNVLRLKSPISVTATQDRFVGVDDDGKPKLRIKAGEKYSVVGVTPTGNVLLAETPGEGWGFGFFLQNNMPLGFNKFGVK